MHKFYDLIKELKSTNSSNEKKEILTKYKDIHEVRILLYYTLNPFFKYWVSVNKIEEYSEIKWIWENYWDLLQLLDDLKDKKLTGHRAIETLKIYIWNISEMEREVLNIILDKDLKANTWISLINKIFLDENWKGLIPQYKVSLATKLVDVLKKGQDELDFETIDYMGSRKLDGVRVTAIFNNEWTDVKFYSRKWNEFLTLNVLKTELLNYVNINPDIINYVLDWEVCIIDENGSENFKKIVWDIKRKNFTIETPIYKLFDIIEKEWFLNAYSDDIFISRYNHLLNTKLNEYSNNLDILEHSLLNSKTFTELLELWRNLWWEWLIIRNANMQYEGKRTKHMIKVKDFIDAEFEVIWTVNWIMPILINWEMIDTDILSSVEIEYKWNIVNIWSGFSQEERLEYYKNPQNIKWKFITVKYFEESTDKDWNPSLRFPTFHWIRDYE